MEDERLKGYLAFQLNRNIISLYKKLFEIVEDVKQEHSTMLEKVEKKTSKEFVESIDYLSDNKVNYIRKKILDSGNDAIRNIENNFKAVKITLK
jgi:vacuolar-type H+-ATPase subunit H